MNSWECLGGAKVKIGHDGVESRRGKALNRDKRAIAGGTHDQTSHFSDLCGTGALYRADMVVADCVGVDRAPTRLPRRPRPAQESAQRDLVFAGLQESSGPGSRRGRLLAKPQPGLSAFHQVKNP